MATPKATPKPVAPKPKAVAVKLKPPPVKKAAPKAPAKDTSGDSRTTARIGSMNKAVNPVDPKSLWKVAPKATTKGNSAVDQVGNFIGNRIGQMTGRIATPISGAMKNPTPVIPYTQKNIKAIKQASGK